MLLDKSSDKPDFQAAFLQISSQITRKICVLDVALVLHQKQGSELVVGFVRQKDRARVGFRHERRLN